MLMQEERELIVEIGKQMSTSGLCPGTSGNQSIYNPELGLMAIKPSGIGYMETTPEDIVVMDLESHVVDGKRKPSSEWDMHTEFYKNKPNCRAIVHTHQRFCTTFAVLGMPIQAVHYVLADANCYEIPCAPYHTFGTPELAQDAVKTCGTGDAGAGPGCSQNLRHRRRGPAGQPRHRRLREEPEERLRSRKEPGIHCRAAVSRPVHRQAQRSRQGRDG